MLCKISLRNIFPLVVLVKFVLQQQNVKSCKGPFNDYACTQYGDKSLATCKKIPI